MATDIEVLPLKDLVDSERGISYGIVQPGQHVPEGIPIVRVTDIRDGRISTRHPLRVASEIAERYRRTRLRGGELLLTLVGTVGEAAVVPPDLAGWNTARAVAVLPIRSDPGPRWVQYALRTGAARAYIDMRLNTTVQATLNLRDVATFPVPLPDRSTREAILSTIGALEDKIELNRRMNETLEAMARGLFKSWFIDFDPVRARVARRAPVGMDAATAALFPETMERGYPAGWVMKPYAEGVTVTKGKSYKSEELQPCSTALVTLKSFVRGGGYRDDGLKAYVGEYKPEQVIVPGDLVVAFTDVTQAAEIIGKPALVRASSQFTTLVASLDVGIVRSRAAELPTEYLYYRFLDSEFQEHAYAHSNGSTVLHLASDAIAKYEGIWPSRACADAFRRTVRSLIDLQNVNWTQASTLVALRDLLLPKLLSGELRVRDAEREVEKVA